MTSLELSLQEDAKMMQQEPAGLLDQLHYKVPRKGDGGVDRGQVADEDWRFIRVMGPENFERFQHVQAFRAMGFELNEDDNALLDYWRNDVMPQVKQHDETEELLGMRPDWYAGLEDNVLGPITRGLSNILQPAVDLSVAGANFIASDEDIESVDVRSGLKAFSEWTARFVGAKEGNADIDQIYQEELLREEVRLSKAGIGGVLEQGAGVGGDIFGMFVRGPIASAFRVAASTNLAKSSNFLFKHLPSAALYAGVATTRESVQPGSGDRGELEVLRDAAINGALWYPMMMIGQFGAKTANKILSPDGQAMNRMVSGYAAGAGAKSLPKEFVLPTHPGELKAFWTRKWITDGMPGWHPPKSKAWRAWLAKSAAETAGFSMLDTEIWKDSAAALLEGDGEAALRAAERVGATAIGIGAIGFGSVANAYRAKRDTFPMYEPIAPSPDKGAGKVTAKDALEKMGEKPRELPPDLQLLGFREQADGSFAHDARRDIALRRTEEGVLEPSAELKGKLTEGVDQVEATRHFVMRDQLSGRRELAGVGTEVDVDGTRVVSSPDGSRLYKQIDGKVYTASPNDRVWTRVEGQIEGQNRVKPRAEQLQEVARLGLGLGAMVEPSPEVLRTVAEAVRTLSGVSELQDPVVRDAMRLIRPEVDQQTGQSVPGKLLRDLAQAGSDQAVVDKILMDFAAVVAGAKSLEKSVADVEAARQMGLAAAGLGVGDLAKGPKPPKSPEETKGDAGRDPILRVGGKKAPGTPKPPKVKGAKDDGADMEAPGGELAAEPAKIGGPSGGEAPAAKPVEKPTAVDLTARAKAEPDAAKKHDLVLEAIRTAHQEMGDAAPEFIRSSPSRSAEPLRRAAKKMGVKKLGRKWDDVVIDMLEKSLPKDQQLGPEAGAILVEDVLQAIADASSNIPVIGSAERAAKRGAKAWKDRQRPKRSESGIPENVGFFQGMAQSAFRLPRRLVADPISMVAKNLPLVDVSKLSLDGVRSKAKALRIDGADKMSEAELRTKTAEAVKKAQRVALDEMTRMDLLRRDLERQLADQVIELENLTARTEKPWRDARNWLEDSGKEFEVSDGLRFNYNNFLVYLDGLKALDSSIPAEARRIIDVAHDLVNGINKMEVDNNRWIELPSGDLAPYSYRETDYKLPRSLASDGVWIMSNPNSPAFDAFVRGQAAVPENKMTYEQARRAATRISRMVTLESGDMKSSYARESHELSRAFETMPSEMIFDGQRYKILNTRTQEVGPALLDKPMAVIASGIVVGQKLDASKVDARLKKHPREKRPKMFKSEIFDDLMAVVASSNAEKHLNAAMRSLYGMQTGDTIRPSFYFHKISSRILMPLTGMYRSGKLSGTRTAVLNVLETLNTLGAKAGPRDTFIEWGTVFSAYAKHILTGRRNTAFIKMLEEAQEFGMQVPDKVSGFNVLRSLKKGEFMRDLSKASRGVAFLQREANIINEVISFRVAQRTIKASKEGKLTADQFDTIMEFELPADMRQRFLDGTITKSDEVMYSARMAAFTQGSGRSGSLGKFQQSRVGKMFPFQTFIRNYTRNNLNFAENFARMVDLAMAGEGVDAGRAAKRLGREFTHKAVFAAWTLVIGSFIAQGVNAILLSEGEDAKRTAQNFGEEVMKQFSFQELFGGPVIGSIVRQTVGGQDAGSPGEVISGIARATPIGWAVDEAWRFATNERPYYREETGEKILRFFKNTVPLLRDVYRWGELATEEGAPVKIARNRFYKFLQSKDLMPDYPAGVTDDFTIMMQQFKKAFIAAGADQKTMTDMDIRKILADAAGLKSRARSWASISATLSGYQMLRRVKATETQTRGEILAELRSTIGSRNYETIVEYDKALARWIDYANRRK